MLPSNFLVDSFVFNVLGLRELAKVSMDFSRGKRGAIYSRLWNIKRLRLFSGRDLIVRKYLPLAVELRSRGRVGIDVSELYVQPNYAPKIWTNFLSRLFPPDNFFFVGFHSCCCWYFTRLLNKVTNFSYLKTSASCVDFQAEIKQVFITARLNCLVFTYIKLVISLL